MSLEGKPPPEAESAPNPGAGQLGIASLTALGVVYGDIGTSPLYAFRQAFREGLGVAASQANILGVLSLIFWSLILVVSLKYLIIILRADNDGEGGILALAALVTPQLGLEKQTKTAWSLMLLGVPGAALLYGDATITPAISVLSAVEGLGVSSPDLHELAVPITAAILIALFMVQRRGTAAIGLTFGPVMLVWFAILAVLGIGGILAEPRVLAALDPRYALSFFTENGWAAFIVLGVVFLAVTGAEALYADLGHFGAAPIRAAWFVIALPALVLNYFGQGAAAMMDGGALAHPFYALAPSWAHYPLVLLATIATIIASQAVISGIFSLTRQAIQLGYLPRLSVIHTKGAEEGQIYVPFVNWGLMVAALALVVAFKTSGALGAAYGLAVSLTMVLTTILAFFALTWLRMPRWVALPALGAFLLFDLAFFTANTFKIAEGGWYPLMVGIIGVTLMLTWKRGSEVITETLKPDRPTTSRFLEEISKAPPLRVAGTAVFLSKFSFSVPPTLVHYLEHVHTLHERVILLTITVIDRPRVPAAERLEITQLEQGFWRVRAYYGFMQSPNVPVIMRLAEEAGLALPGKLTYFLGREAVVASPAIHTMGYWREVLFAFMTRAAVGTRRYYNIPPDEVVELGMQIEI